MEDKWYDYEIIIVRKLICKVIFYNIWNLIVIGN